MKVEGRRKERGGGKEGGTEGMWGKGRNESAGKEEGAREGRRE